jgi:hypothetical protein
MYNKDRTLAKYKNDIYIHKGLLQQFQDIEDNIYYNINTLNNRKLLKKIYVGGYYMGGGLATIAASVIAEKYKNMFLVSCFTFGAPMVGNCGFKQFFKEIVSNNYRIILNDTNDEIKCSLDFYNCYKHHKYKYKMYNKFYDGSYCHVSNALQLTPDVMLEFKKPKLNKTDRILKHFYKIDSHTDLIQDIDVYIIRLQSIISTYKENIAKYSQNYSLKEGHNNRLQDAIIIDVPSHSSSESRLSNDDCANKEDILIIENKLERMNQLISEILFSINRNISDR